MDFEASNSTKTHRILILEDEFLFARDLKDKLIRVGHERIEIASTLSEASVLIEELQIDMAIIAINLNGVNKGIVFSQALAKKNIPFIFLTSHSGDEVVSLAKKCRPQGYLMKPVDVRELKATIEICLYRHAFENSTRKEKERKFLLDLNTAIAQLRNKREFFRTVSNSLISLYNLDRTPHIGLINEDETIKLIFDDLTKEVDEEFLSLLEKFNNFPITEGIREILEKDEPTIINEKELKGLVVNDLAHDLIKQGGIKSCMIIPLRMGKKTFGFFNIASTVSDFFGFSHFELIKAVANQISLAIENNLYFEEIRILKEKAVQEKEYLSEEINSDHNLDFFIGKSSQIQKVKEEINRVANLDTSILITGETGTGKELVARSIHNTSRTKSHPLVKVNCAALPTHLIESELFGHEKGSFSGAINQRIGKFELANDGIIFLDEIGELPLELQPKLLRVIQEKEIERIGGSKPINLNVKIIAATNRNLEKEIKQGNFRADLYYRLNVFPIHVPALRSRKEDIPHLAAFFLEKSAKKIGKRNTRFSEATMNAFINYDWPGNIRELQHFIEREVILSDSQEIDITPTKLNTSATGNEISEDEFHGNKINPVKTLRQSEIQIIVETLKHTNGKVRGTGGAAEILDINPSTLESRIRKLGIVKPQII